MPYRHTTSNISNTKYVQNCHVGIQQRALHSKFISLHALVQIQFSFPFLGDPMAINLSPVSVEGCSCCSSYDLAPGQVSTITIRSKDINI